MSEDGSELDVQLDDDGVSLSALVAETWIWRNEKMGNIAPDEWVLLFDDCVWLLGDDGLHATIPSWPLTLYRCGHPEGMSWAMNIESALHFQKMRPHEPVWKCSVADCSDLLAIFHSRNESEAVLRPDGA